MNLYQEHILEHFKHPCNYGLLKTCTHQYTDSNPLCGDWITMQAHVKDGRICAIGFESAGCTICKASASMLTEFVLGKEISLVYALSNQDVLDLLHIELSISRIKCALLCFVALKKALYGVRDAAD